MRANPASLEPQCEWTAADVADEDDLDRAASTTPSSAELDAALRHALAKSDDVLELGRDDFPLPTLRHRLAGIERRAHQRPRLRAAPRHRPRRVHAGRDGDPLLGHRHAPRPAVGAEQARPRARRRHRPGQGASTTRPRAATSSAASRCRSTATAPTSSGCMCLENGIARRPVGGRELGAHPQPARARAARPRGRALRGASRTTSAASSRRAASRTTRCRCSPSGTTGSSCAASRRTSGRRNATPTRPASPTLQHEALQRRRRAWPTTRRTTC